MKLILVIGLLVTAGCLAAGKTEPRSVQQLTFEQLLKRLQKYGDTPASKSSKQMAATELRRRGAASLKFLLENADIRSIAVFVHTEQLVKNLKEEEVVPVLVGLLPAPKADTRKMAAYHLGEFERPEHAEALYPLLEEEYTAGAAIRTLGKWKVRDAVARILPFLQDEDERRRVLAANALGAIGEPDTASALIQALDDAVATVRKSAARALTAMGEKVEQPLLDALGSETPKRRREVIRVLGLIDSEKAIGRLRSLLTAPAEPWQICVEAARALLTISPDEAPGWIAQSEAAKWVNSDGTLRTSALPSRR